MIKFHLKQKIKDFSQRRTVRFLSAVLAFMLIFGGVIFSLVSMFGKPPVAKAAWYSTSWPYRQEITLYSSKVPNTDQTDFPVLVKITDAGNSIFAHAKSDGSDIRFTQSDATTPLHAEIEKFDAASHELDAWVKIPTLSHSSDTTIYMYYGNSGASAPSASDADWGSQGVWSNGYAGVWHFPNGSSLLTADSTGNGNSASGGSAGAGSGQIDGDVTFNGSQSINVPGNPSSLDIYGTNKPLTLSAWLKFDDFSSATIPINKGSYPNYEYRFAAGGGYNLDFTVSVGGFNQVLSTHAMDTNMHYWTGVYNGTTTMTLYQDGAYDNSRSDLTGSVTQDTSSLFLGAYSGGAYNFSGQMDEVRLSSVARSSDWIATEYANQNSPSTFEGFGTEQDADTIAPSNPTSFSGYSDSGKSISLTSGHAYTYSTPYIEWPAAETAGGAHDTGEVTASGVAGYYTYFGTTCGAGGADPAASRGVLADTGGGLHYSADTNVSVPALSSDGNYCLRIKTADNLNNISDVYEAFDYTYDTTAPSAPSYIAVNPAGYSSVDSFDFSWPAASDNAGGSGLAGYQYERGSGSGDSWSATQADASVSGINKYQDGSNVFLVRSVDNAGNTSDSVQTTYYYSANPPTKPTNLIATPALSESNSFSFSWTAPSSSIGIAEYGYSINALPTANNLTWTGSTDTTLAAGPYATEQGDNTIYLVAKDNSGAYSLADASVASTTFNCTTVAPPIPVSVSVSDSSNHDINLWALTIKWAAGAGQDSGTFSHYLIERSLDGNSFSTLATVTSAAYIDATGLNNTTTYYYRIKAIDNAGSTSAASTVVSKIPSGKYDTPPTIVSNPTVSAKSTTATISWVVNRVSSSAVRFGTSESSMPRSQIDPNEKTSQSISLVGLQANTKYYYQVQSLDTYRDYSSDAAYSSTYTFTTLSAPTIAHVSVSNITLHTADITWETSSASNTKVYFGNSISYGAIIPEDNNSLTTQHTVKLSLLADTAKYHFKIFGDDIDGNVLSSDDYTFETLPLPKISQIQYQPDFSGPAPVVVISWITNVPTSSAVEYSPKDATENVTFEESQSALVVQHKVTLSNLKDSTDYKFQVKGMDQFGNVVISDMQILKTGVDTRPPVISDIELESSNIGNQTGSAQLVVSWQTDEDANGQVEYGPGLENNTAMKKTAADQGYSKQHVAVITGLEASMPYHIRVVSQDRAGNTAQSDNIITTTGSVQKTVFSMVISVLSDLFGWLGKIYGQ